MPGGDAHLVDVRGADALLDADCGVIRRRALAQEERHELDHARVDEQQIGIVEDHRGAGHLGVTGVHEVIQEPLPDLMCLHGWGVLVFGVRPGVDARSVESITLPAVSTAQGQAEPWQGVISRPVARAE